MPISRRSPVPAPVTALGEGSGVGDPGQAPGRGRVRDADASSASSFVSMLVCFLRRLLELQVQAGDAEGVLQRRLDLVDRAPGPPHVVAQALEVVAVHAAAVLYTMRAATPFDGASRSARRPPPRRTGDRPASSRAWAPSRRRVRPSSGFTPRRAASSNRVLAPARELPRRRPRDARSRGRRTTARTRRRRQISRVPPGRPRTPVTTAGGDALGAAAAAAAASIALADELKRGRAVRCARQPSRGNSLGIKISDFVRA